MMTVVVMMLMTMPQRKFKLQAAVPRYSASG